MVWCRAAFLAGRLGTICADGELAVLDQDQRVLLLDAGPDADATLFGYLGDVTLDDPRSGVPRAQAGQGGLQYLDYRGQTVRW